MSNVDVNDFGEEKVCVYKNETYSVRDNGAVFRHQREGKRTRRNDNKWTFGKVGDKGYLYIAGVQVHRIVATAFHGEHLSREYIVDHKDINKQNNRPENLHWCTREENVLNNLNTINKIEYITGHSIDEVREDWSILHKVKHKQDTSWMRPVTQKEVKNMKDKQLEWQKNKKQSSNGVMGEWVFNRNNTIRKQTEKERIIEEKYQSYNSDFFSKPDITIITKSLTPNAVQRKWKTPSEFPCCPQEYTEEPIRTYANNLITGSVFCRNDLYSSLVFKSSTSEDKQTIYVITESARDKNSVKPLALAKITFDNGKFVHTSLGSFFSQEGAEKQFCLAQGLEWHGGDSIDDYC